MPRIYTRPMKPKAVRMDPDCRPDYLAGVWDYARGRPAIEHPKYREAVKIAKKGKWDWGWVRTWQDVGATLAGCRFEEKLGQHVVDFFATYLIHAKGRQWAGQPFILMDWQKWDVVMPLFGWVTAEGVRRFTLGSIWVPKKQGKTTLFAGIMLYMLEYDNEYGAECYSAAVKRDQAARIYRDAAAMARKSPRLRRLLHCVDSRNKIESPETNSFYLSLSADAGGAEGVDAHFLIFDEIHALKDAKLWTTLVYSGIARKQPMRMSISTSGVYNPESVGWREWNYATKVKLGVLEAQEYFTYIAAMDPGKGSDAEGADDWNKPKVWKKANPSWGVTINEKEIRKAWKRAKEDAVELADFQRYRLNKWVQSITRWLSVKYWDACGGKFDESMLEGRFCFGGLDLSVCDDLTAWAMIFPPIDEDPRWRLLVRCFLPGDLVREKSERERVPYARWIAEGWVIAGPGNTINYDSVERVIVEDAQRFNIQQIGYDPVNATNVVLRLQDDFGLPMMLVRQGTLTLSWPTKEFKRLVDSGLLAHGDNPALNWMADNAAIKTFDNGNILVSKKNSISKVDGIAAAIDALTLAIGEQEKESVYQGRGLVVV